MSIVKPEAAMTPPITEAQRQHPTAGTTAPRPLMPTEPPKTFTFTNFYNDDPITVQCMVGCQTSHWAHTNSPSLPEDVYCNASGEGVELPFMQGLDRPQLLVLRPDMIVTPLSKDIAERLPTVRVEVIDDGWILGLTPDSLDQVADFLQDRVDALRAASVQLAAVRAEYRGRGK